MVVVIIFSVIRDWLGVKGKRNWVYSMEEEGRKKGVLLRRGSVVNDVICNEMDQLEASSLYKRIALCMHVISFSSKCFVVCGKKVRGKEMSCSSFFVPCSCIS
jgi:hypothetical protein